MQETVTNADSESAQQIYQLLSQSFMRLDTSDAQLMRKYNLTLTQSWALVHLGDPEGRSLSELAQLLICDKSNVTSIVDKLEEEKLGERCRGKAGDRRYTRIVLTEEGRQLRAAIMRARENLVYARLSQLTPTERERLHDALLHLSALLSAQYNSGEEDRYIDLAYTQNQLPQGSGTTKRAQG